MSKIESEIKKIREDLKSIKDDLKTYINQNKLTDETSKEYVEALINSVRGKAIDNPLSIEMWKGNRYKPEKEELSKEYLEHWTCDICGKHTHEVEYDYLGNGTNHLGCELKEEININHEIAAMEAGVDVKREKN
jgi:rubrerythrin